MNHLLTLISIIFLNGCVHKIKTLPDDYSRLNGHKYGRIISTGAGMDGSPFANAALSNGKDEVKSEICPNRRVEFTPIVSGSYTSHNTSAYKIFDRTVLSGTSQKKSIVSAIDFTCWDNDEPPYPTYYMSAEKVKCLKHPAGIIGNKRLKTTLSSSNADSCPDYPGWFRSEIGDGKTAEVFYGPKGLSLCEKFLDEILNNNQSLSSLSDSSLNIFFRKKYMSCARSPKS